jgi:hypothetical protein
MAESPIRKACDRCHAQKLSCKRNKDEACERCIRLKTECKSSPSLRYRKQQPLGDSPPLESRHVRKRRRTDSDGNTVRPNFCMYSQILLQYTTPTECGNPPAAIKMPEDVGYSAKSLEVPQNSMLEIVDFNFSFEQPNMFSPNPNHQHLSLPGVPMPGDMREIDPGDTATNNWDQTLSPYSADYAGSTFSRPATGERSLVAGLASERDRDCDRDRDRDPRPGLISPHDKAELRGSPGRLQATQPAPLSRRIMLKPSADAMGISPERLLPRLMAINTELWELSSNLPVQSVGAATSLISPQLDDEVDETASNPFPIDEIYKLSRHFSDLISPLKKPSAPVSRLSSEATAVNVDGHTVFDPGTSLLMLSTYVRLLDMYQNVFSIIHWQLIHQDSEGLLKTWRLPDVTVGSFAVVSTPSLQICLTVQLAEEFLSQLRLATAVFGPPPTRVPSQPASLATNRISIFTGVVDISYQAIKSREQELRKQLADLRGVIDSQSSR